MADPTWEPVAGPAALDVARDLLHRSGLPVPPIPADLVPDLRRLEEWTFASRPMKIWAYDIAHYLEEAAGDRVRDYVLLSHAGYGLNSWALHFYLVRGPLRLFLQNAWGGVYADPQKARAEIRECFDAAARLVAAAAGARAAGRLGPGDRLVVAASSLYASHWTAGGVRHLDEELPGRGDRPVEALEAALAWVAERGPTQDRTP